MIGSHLHFLIFPFLIEKQWQFLFLNIPHFYLPMIFNTIMHCSRHTQNTWPLTLLSKLISGLLHPLKPLLSRSYISFVRPISVCSSSSSIGTCINYFYTSPKMKKLLQVEVRVHSGLWMHFQSKSKNCHCQSARLE